MLQENSFMVEMTNLSDLPVVLWMFEQAMAVNKPGYKVWPTIDTAALQKDIENGLQYKLIQTNQIRCVFSVQFSDPFIWGDRDRTDAVYLHRIVVHPDFKGQRQFDCVLEWAKGLSRQRKLSCIRMDTWADNDRIINYYKSFGFAFVGVRTTGNHSELPIQNRNLNVALLEMKVDNI